MGVSCTLGAPKVWMLSPRNWQEGMTSVCVIIPPTHSRAVRITPLTESILHEGLQHVLRANKTLQRSLPKKDGTVTEKVLGGEGYQSRAGLRTFRHNQTPHVTGRNRLERANGVGATKPVCVYTDRWYQFDYPQQRFVPCHPPYVHPQNTTIVGSRRITLQMTQELHNLFQRTIQMETRPLPNFWFH